MPIRGLLVGVIALAALAGGVYWSEKASSNKDESKTAPKADASPKLIAIAEDQAQKFEIKKNGEDTLVEKDGSGKWKIQSAKPLPVDQDAASAVVGSLSGLTWDRLVEDKAGDLSQYGLSAPALQATLTGKGGQSKTVLIGDETPTKSGYYAKLDGDARVFTIASGTKSGLDKTAQDLRDKRLMTFETEKVSRIEVTADKKTFELGKNNQNEWQIIKPKPYRADGFQVEEFLRKMKETRVENEADADKKKAAEHFAVGAPIIMAKVSDNTGTQQIEVKKSYKEQDTPMYAKSSVVEGVHKLSKDVADGLEKKMEDFVNKKLFDFGFGELSKVEIHDGPKIYLFQKSGDKWTSGGQQMDTVGIQMLIDKLRDLTAASVVDKGFTAPATTITAVWADGKRQEIVLISREGFAMRENEPAIYQIDPATLADVRRAAADVRTAQAAKAGSKK